MTLDTSEAAQYLGLSPRFLEKLRVTGGGPIFIKKGKWVRYRLRDLDEFLERHSLRSTSEITERASA